MLKNNKVGSLQDTSANEVTPNFYDSLGFFSGYDENVAGISLNVFATASFRFAHTLVDDFLDLRVSSDAIDDDPQRLKLADFLFVPVNLLFTGDGVDGFLSGSCQQNAQRYDTTLVDSLQNRLFQAGRPFGLDLFSLNVQRGRDHGLFRDNYAIYYLSTTNPRPLSIPSSDSQVADQQPINHTHPTPPLPRPGLETGLELNEVPVTYTE